jgi:hypothetical protein
MSNCKNSEWQHADDQSDPTFLKTVSRERRAENQRMRD